MLDASRVERHCTQRVETQAVPGGRGCKVSADLGWSRGRNVVPASTWRHDGVASYRVGREACSMRWSDASRIGTMWCVDGRVKATPSGGAVTPSGRQGPLRLRQRSWLLIKVPFLAWWLVGVPSSLDALRSVRVSDMPATVVGCREVPKSWLSRRA